MDTLEACENGSGRSRGFGWEPPPPSPDNGREITIVTIEGNIGSGKSTAIAELKKMHPEYTYVDEPVDLWVSSGLLQAMYKKEVDIAVFQQVALATLVAPLLKAAHSGATTIVTERSPWSNREIFARAHLKENTWEEIAYNVVFDSLMCSLPKYTVRIAYLQASIVELQKRIVQRARESEDTKTTIRVDYLKELERLHEDYFFHSPTVKTRVDATQSPHEVARSLSQFITSSIVD